MLQAFLSKLLTPEEQQQKLEELAASHPYFTPAQFHLLLNKIEAGEEHDELAAKNSVLFNNPLWLNFQLAQYSKKEVVPVEIAPIEEPVIMNEPVAEISPVAAEETDPSADNGIISAEAAPASYEAPGSVISREEDNAPALLKEILNQPASSFPDELPAFQPLYSSDYFASQGIKLSDEIQSGDKLGKQLKSFTEWLKGMKRLHPEKLEEKLGAQQPDATVQKQAEKSNSEGDVLTEAMAEVLALQGKSDKAEDIYQKLSLLNPSKSAYFAAKIEQLKSS